MLLLHIFHFLSLSLIVKGVEKSIPAVEPSYLDMLRRTRQVKSFGQLLGIADPGLLYPDPEEDSSKDPMQNEALDFGDILPAEQFHNEYTAANLTMYPSFRWKKGIVPYYISTSDYNRTERALIKECIADFNSKVTNIQLKQHRAFRDKDYVMVFSGNGCYARLGRYGGQQPLSLQANRCLDIFRIQHEFMHAIGFIHEQNRPDRDEYIELLPENIAPRYMNQFDKLDSPIVETLGTYDYYSVMHYGVKAASENGEPTFKVLKEGIDADKIGHGHALTEQDIEKLNAYYSKKEYREQEFEVAS